MKSDVSDAVNACRRFFQLAVEARVVAACLNILHMESLDGTPADTHKFSGDESPSTDKKGYLTKAASLVVDSWLGDFIGTSILNLCFICTVKNV